MDDQTFSSLQGQLKNATFFDNKKGVLQSFLSNYWFNGDQAAKVISEFPHATEKEEVIGLIAPRLTVLTGADAKKIVEAFTFAGGKLKAVELVANHINDPAGKYVVLDAIDFHFDKEKARKILDQATPPPSHHGHCQPCGQPGQPPCTNPVPSYPCPPGTQPYNPPAGQPYQPPAQPYQPPAAALPYNQPPAASASFSFQPPSISVQFPAGFMPPLGGQPYQPPPPTNPGYQPPQGGYQPPQGGAPGYPPPAGYPPYGYPPQ